MGNDCNNVPKTISVRDGLAWARQQKLQTGRAVARSRHTGEWRMSIVNQLGFLIVVTSTPRHSPVSHHGHFIADNYVMEAVRNCS